MSFTSASVRTIKCEVCGKPDSIRLYRPCNHLFHCADCSDVYLQTVGANAPGRCPLCGTSILKFHSETLFGLESSIHFFVPSVGYCTKDYLESRLFVSPSGITWTYRPELSPEVSIPADYIISIPLAENRPRPEIAWEAVHQRRETPTTISSDIFSADTTPVVRPPTVQ
jgi:Zinc finger, C3HC4 type (RING finger)